MVGVGLFDGSFAHQASMTLGGDNSLESPENIIWTRNTYMPTTVFTDMLVADVARAPRDISRIALLVEPQSMSTTHYEKAMELRDEFDCILTFSREYVETGNNFIWYALGGSWIDKSQFGIYPKNRNVSIIASQKTRTEGHKLRHVIAGECGKFHIDLYGRGYNPIQSKAIALQDYRYSIIVENGRIKGYFSEKLIDCLSQGTIPIYWGCYDVREYFDMRGIITFSNMDELHYILNDIVSEEDYYNRRRAIAENLARAWDYRCAEDWIYKNYPYLFEEQ